MRSIRRRIFINLVLGLLVSFAIAGAGFYVYVRLSLIDQFDQSLLDRLETFAATTDLEDFVQAAALIKRSRIADAMPYCEVWDQNGNVVARSPSLHEADLPRLTDLSGSVVDVRLPNGRRGRMAVVRFHPRIEKDSPDGETTFHSAAQYYTAAMAQSRKSLDVSLRTLLIALLLMGAVLPLAAVGLVAGVTRRELRPLERVARVTADIGADDLDRRVPVGDVPEEVRPLCLRLNELLARLEQAFRRERRFTSAAAHELRTPISELRLLAEVALRTLPRSGEGDDLRTSFDDVLSIALQMERLVTTLLAHTHCETGRWQPQAETVDVVAVARRAWSTHAAHARAKGCVGEFEAPDEVLVETDPALLATVLGNLCSNAVAYVPAGGRVHLGLVDEGDAVRVTLTNSQDNLDAEHLDRLFEPFWRRDEARADGLHAGLGLTLAADFAGLLGAAIKADLQPPGCITFTLELPKARSRTVPVGAV